MSRLRIEIRGVVQGVGFRWFTRRAAGRIGLAGFVRNEPDGSVCCEAEGTDEALQALLAELRQGPRGSRVDEVRARPIDPEGGQGFEIR